MTSTGHPESRSPLASQHSKLHRLNVIRDALAGALLVLGLLLPWNLEVGITIGLDGWILTVLLLVTSGSLAALAFSHVGPLSIAAGETPTATINRIRQWCNTHGQTPHLLLPKLVDEFVELIVAGPPLDPGSDEKLDRCGGEDERLVCQFVRMMSMHLTDDPADAWTALSQFDDFMASVESPTELLEMLDSP